MAYNRQELFRRAQRTTSDGSQFRAGDLERRADRELGAQGDAITPARNERINGAFVQRTYGQQAQTRRRSFGPIDRSGQPSQPSIPPPRYGGVHAPPPPRSPNHDDRQAQLRRMRSELISHYEQKISTLENYKRVKRRMLMGRLEKAQREYTELAAQEQQTRQTIDHEIKVRKHALTALRSQYVDAALIRGLYREEFGRAA